VGYWASHEGWPQTLHLDFFTKIWLVVDQRADRRPDRAMVTDAWNEALEGIFDPQRADHPSTARLALHIRNGLCQHIFSLGTFGFVICDHVAKKILVVDPWPTHHSDRIDAPACSPRPLLGKTVPLRGDPDRAKISGSNLGRARIAALASFLRRAVEQEYELSAILLSHTHFDHVDDVGLLLELLVAEEDGDGWFLDDPVTGGAPAAFTDHLSRAFALQGSAVECKHLPPIVADFDTMFFIQAVVFGAPLDALLGRSGIDQAAYFAHNDELKLAADRRRQNPVPRTKPAQERWWLLRERYTCVVGPELVHNNAWREVGDSNKRRLVYDDGYNSERVASERTMAGAVGTSPDVSGFEVQPYVYDHLNVGFGKKSFEQLDGQSSGDLQRISAFLVHAKADPEQRKTILIGSGGEMSARWSGAVNRDLDISADLLIFATVRPNPIDIPIPILGPLVEKLALNFDDQIQESINFLIGHVRVGEAVVFAHFEEFMREVAGTKKYRSDLTKAVSFSLKKIRARMRSLSERGEGAKATAEAWNELFERNRFYVLARRGEGFERPMPLSPEDFAREGNEHVG